MTDDEMMLYAAAPAKIDAAAKELQDASWRRERMEADARAAVQWEEGCRATLALLIAHQEDLRRQAQDACLSEDDHAVLRRSQRIMSGFPLDG